MHNKRGNVFLSDKKGQGLSTNAIVLIILGVIVLAILAIGFFFGWQTLLPWIQQDNVDTIVQQCQIECDFGNKFAFCSQERTLRAGGEEVATETCSEFATNPEYSAYGISECPQITCSVDEEENSEE
ncbi:MAG: hypothetical protein WDZ69_03050 [Candidatus Pacearchaeota archaeon]